MFSWKKLIKFVLLLINLTRYLQNIEIQKLIQHTVEVNKYSNQPKNN